MAPTLLIVDDHVAFRTFARTLLASEGFDVVGEASDGESALLEAERLQPDVVLLDVQLPGMDGIEVSYRLARSARPPVAVLTSTRNEADYGARLTESPASGFIAKQDISGEALARLVAEA